MTDDELDTALAQYSRVEPLAGLEQRILNRVSAEGRARRFGFWPWLAALAIAMLLMTALLWKKPVPAPHLAAVRLEGGLQPPRGLSPAPSRRKPPLRRIRKPLPLTPEERALLALVANAPDQAREAFKDLQRQSNEPIQLEAIKIEPLRSHDDEAK